MTVVNTRDPLVPCVIGYTGTDRQRVVYTRKSIVDRLNAVEEASKEAALAGRFSRDQEAAVKRYKDCGWDEMAADTKRQFKAHQAKRRDELIACAAEAVRATRRSRAIPIRRPVAQRPEVSRARRSARTVSGVNAPPGADQPPPAEPHRIGLIAERSA